MGELLLLPSLKARLLASGRTTLTKKFVDGTKEYARLWPGQVTACLAATEQRDTNLDPVEIRITDGSPRFELRPTSRDAILNRCRRAAIVLVSLTREHTWIGTPLARLGIPVVWISECSYRTRNQIIFANTRNPILRLRRVLWNWNAEREYCRSIRVAAGVQCNGTPTYDAYQPLNSRALLYFDTRISQANVADEAAVLRRSESLRNGKPLRLAFSGRLLAIKGVQHLPSVAAELVRLGVQFEFTICGDGRLRERVAGEVKRLRLSHCVRLTGTLDFDMELVPFIRDNVDLFVCPHVQGDPSCTYLETMSCGVPIVGFDNEALRGIVAHADTGWLVPLGNVGALAELIANIDRNRESLVRAALLARTFALRHTFEETMQIRIGHLMACTEHNYNAKSAEWRI